MSARPAPPAAEFNAATHTYKRSGKRYPSVTTIASFAADPGALMRWNVRKGGECALDDDLWMLMDRDEAVRYIADAGNRERDAAGTRGTAMHDSAEFYLRHGELPKGLDDEQRALAEQCVAFVADFGFRADHIETPLFNDTHRYAGKPDAIGRCLERPDLGVCLPDWKSGSLVVAKFCAQLVAYARAEWLLCEDGSLIEMPKVDSAFVVQVTTEDYTVHPLDIGETEWQAFLAALTVYHHNLRCARKDSPLGAPLRPSTLSDDLEASIA